jgi:hypothetical protein
VPGDRPAPRIGTKSQSVRLAAAVGVDDGGQVLDDEVSGDQRSWKSRTVAYSLSDTVTPLFLISTLSLPRDHDVLAVAEELHRPMLPELQHVYELGEVLDHGLLAAE